MSSESKRSVAGYQRLLEHWNIDVAAISELDDILENMRGTYARVETLAEQRLQTPGAAPQWKVERIAGSDPHHAWMYKVFSLGPDEPAGSLAGRRLVVKDAIAVAGVPMTAGSGLFPDFVPSRSALAVERALAAGADLAGTAVCEDLCYSGSSFTSATGPVLNPHDPKRSAGGSTSGCGALLATGEADIALGTDLGGSVRNPAAWCGVCGLKPTFGLVPYAGAMSGEFSMDHLGLMARSAGDIALLLDAVAGHSDEDPRQAGTGPLSENATQIHDDISGIRIGIVQEGFSWPDRSDPGVDDIVRQAATAMAGMCSGSEEVSVDLHRYARDIHVPISCEGGLATVFEQNSQGSNHSGFYDPELSRAFGKALETRPEQIPLNGKISLIAGQIMRYETKSSVMAQAHALRTQLRAQFDEALRRCDVLVMPSVPMLPHLLPTEPLTSVEYQKLAFEMHDNNCAMNLTGHPALSIPCGTLNGLPVGILLIGRHLDDHLLLRVAQKFQEEVFAAPSLAS